MINSLRPRTQNRTIIPLSLAPAQRSELRIIVRFRGAKVSIISETAMHFNTFFANSLYFSIHFPQMDGTRFSTPIFIIQNQKSRVWNEKGIESTKNRA